jgi:hypothetical protein
MGKCLASWKESFHPCNDQKVVFLMLKKLPEQLIILTQDGSQVTSEDGLRKTVKLLYIHCIFNYRLR